MFDERLQEASQVLTEAGACFHDSHDRIRACEVVARALDQARLEGQMHAGPEKRHAQRRANLRVLRELEHS